MVHHGALLARYKEWTLKLAHLGAYIDNMDQPAQLSRTSTGIALLVRRKSNFNDYATMTAALIDFKRDGVRRRNRTQQYF